MDSVFLSDITIHFLVTATVGTQVCIVIKQSERHAIRGRNVYSYPDLLVVYPVPTKEVTTTNSQQYNCFISNGGIAIPKHACPETKGSNSTTGLILKHVKIMLHTQITQVNKKLHSKRQKEPLKRLLSV